MQKGKERDGLFGNLFNNINDSVFLCDFAEDGFPGRFIEVNSYACQLFGYSRDELLGMNLKDIAVIEGPEMETKTRITEQFISGRQHITYEAYGRGKNGECIPLEYSCHIFNLGKKKVCFTITRDITERIKAEKRLRKSEGKYRSLFNNIKDILFVCRIDNHDLPGDFMEINEIACEKLGYSRAEFLKMSPRDISPFDPARIVNSYIYKSYLETGEINIETVFITKYGCLIPVEINAHIIEYNEQNVLLAIARDITERKKAEAELKQSENKYRVLFENLKDPVFVVKLKNRTKEPEKIIEVNITACTKLEYSKEELLSLSPFQIINKELILVKNPELEKTYQKSERVFFETDILTKTGKSIPVEVHGNLVDYAGEKVALAIARDISERKLAEIELKESEGRYRQLVELLPDAIIVHDLQGQILFANMAAVNMTKINDASQLLGRSIMDFVHQDNRELVMERLRNITIFERMPFEQMKIIDAAGNEKYTEIAGVLIDYHNRKVVMIIVRDITERKKAEQVMEETRKILYEKEKLALIGQMSAGLAHEIRNPLTIVRGFSQLLKIRQHSKEKVDSFVDTIVEEIDRVNNLISDFLQLARPKEPTLKMQSIMKVILESLDILKPHALLYNVDIEFVSNVDSVKCLFDRDQIKQVFFNLCKNSLEAMPQGGKIMISIGKAASGNEIYLAVKDTGCGIPADKISKLGDPFFTNKEKGTGLGLSISYSIIRTHKGRIEVNSEEGKGTEFCIYLPISG